MSRNGLIAALAVALVTGLLFGFWPQLDLAIAGAFRDAQGAFNARDVWFLNQLRQKSMWVVALLVAPAVIAIIGKLIFPRRRMLISGNAALFLVATLALAPGVVVNGIVKEHSGRPRPAQVEELGGREDFKAWYDFSGGCEQNCSFVSGEASGGYWTIAPAALAPPQWRAVAYGAAIAYGTAVGILRMAFGGHFASDVIFAGVVTFLIIWLVYALIYRWRTRLPEGAVEGWLEGAGLRLRGQRPGPAAQAAPPSRTDGGIREPLGESTSERVRKRLASARPFEESFEGNLRRKLSSGALRPEVAEQVRAELLRRGETGA